MRFIANCSSTGNMQIELMMIQCILQSEESLITTIGGHRPKSLRWLERKVAEGETVVF